MSGETQEGEALDVLIDAAERHAKSLSGPSADVFSLPTSELRADADRRWKPFRDAVEPFLHQRACGNSISDEDGSQWTHLFLHKRRERCTLAARRESLCVAWELASMLDGAERCLAWVAIPAGHRAREATERVTVLLAPSFTAQRDHNASSCE